MSNIDLKNCEQITEEDLERKFQIWLQEKEIVPTKLNRQFCDGVALAKLLKQLFPRLVESHNYSKSSSLNNKIANWETLNRKVLSKLDLQLKKATIEQLAKATPGAIEKLLIDIMLLEHEVTKDTSQEDQQEQIWAENDETMLVTVNRQVGDAIVQVPQKMILYSIYERELRDSLAKDAQLKAMQQKLNHLEEILELKCQRIEDLTEMVNKLKARAHEEDAHNNTKHNSSSSLKLMDFEGSDMEQYSVDE